MRGGNNCLLEENLPYLFPPWCTPCINYIRVFSVQTVLNHIKTIIFVLAALLTFSFTACGSKTSTASQTAVSSASVNNSSKLILLYSEYCCNAVVYVIFVCIKQTIKNRSIRTPYYIFKGIRDGMRGRFYRMK